MGLGIDVRVDPQRDGGGHAHFCSDLLQALELLGGFDVEAVHADFQGATHVVTALADAGVDDFARFAARGQHPLQFAARDDVEAGAQACQQVQHAEVGIRLDGKTDQVRQVAEGVGIGAELRLDVRTRVHVGGRAEALGERGQCHAFREQLTVAVRKGFHE